MREIGVKGQTVVVNIKDPFCDDTHSFLVRIPTAKEVSKYLAEMFKRGGKNIVANTFLHNAKSAVTILEGIKSETIAYENRPLSSEPDNSGYRENWREILLENAPEILAPIGNRFFAGASIETEDMMDPLG